MLVAAAAHAEEGAPFAVASPAPYASVIAPSRSLRDDSPKALRRHRIMMGTGWSLFGTSYLTSTGFGITALSNASSDSLHFGPLMVTPVVGPMVLGVEMIGDTRPGWFRDIEMIVGGLMIFDGVVQLTGLVLGIVGTVELRRDRAPAKISFAPLLSPTMAGAGVMGRF